MKIDESAEWKWRISNENENDESVENRFIHYLRLQPKPILAEIHMPEFKDCYTRNKKYFLDHSPKIESTVSDELHELSVRGVTSSTLNTLPTSTRHPCSGWRFGEISCHSSTSACVRSWTVCEGFCRAWTCLYRVSKGFPWDGGRVIPWPLFQLDSDGP